MPKPIFTWGIIAALCLLIGGFLLWNTNRIRREGAVACTMEAKICPDGSAVGRSGPNCEFAACPDTSATGTAATGDASGHVEGVAFLSPTCPVERIPPDPTCSPKGFKGVIEVTPLHGTNVVSKTTSGSDGSFTFVLPVGTYLFHAVSAGVYPHCTDVQAEVTSGKSTKVSISCDTGIRTPTSTGGAQSVHLGETYTAGTLSVTPLSVVEDSRCPVDVQCIQAGTVKIQARIGSELGNYNLTLTLGVPVTSEAGTITLTDVVPSKNSKIPITNPDYLLTFSVALR